MDPSIPTKKIKNNDKQDTINPNIHKQQYDQQGWIKLQLKPLTVSICDHSKLNKYHSHRSIQKYIRYLTINTCPNPMWLSIKRQSQIKYILYLDIEIEGRLFQKMMEQGQLQFFSELDKCDQKAIFRKSPIMRQKLWETLFCYDEQLAKQQKLPTKIEQSNSMELNKDLFEIFKSYLLTPNQLRNNLYPTKGLPLYDSYFKVEENNIEIQQKQLKNMILCVDCQMVITQKGFQLARTTICNYNGEVIYDQFFQPQYKILNYNTQYSGITKQILDPVTNNIKDNLHPKLAEIINSNTILVGHSLENDLNAMKMIHGKVIDTSVVFQRKNGAKLKLKNLAYKILNRTIQVETHDSIEDCTATLDLLKAKVYSDRQQKQQQCISEYHLLKELSKEGNNVLIIDHEIDKMKKYSSLKFQKVDEGSAAKCRLQIILKYLEQEMNEAKQYSKPPLLISRLIKTQQNKQWQQYYKDINHGIQNVFTNLRKGTLFFLNFQINDSIQIILPNQNNLIQRPFCFINVKN